jgi:hypothetical protein
MKWFAHVPVSAIVVSAFVAFAIMTVTSPVATAQSESRDRAEPAHPVGQSTGTDQNDINLNGLVPVSPSRFSYRQLRWSDFKVDDNAPGMSAQTQTFIKFRYSSTARRVGLTYDARVSEVVFEGGFDRAKSWRRSTVPSDDICLLAHEQGHIDINEIHLRRLKALAPSSFPTGSGASAREALADLGVKVKAIYDAEVVAMQEEQKRYDQETRHGTIRPAQKLWALRLKQALENPLP